MQPTAKVDPITLSVVRGVLETMRAVADQLPAMQCPQHRLVALVGTGKLSHSSG